MTQRRTSLVTSGLAIAACAAVAACSGPAGNPTPGSGPAGVTTPSAGAAVTHAPVSQTYCRLSPASLVSSALGLTAGTLQPTVEGPSQICAYNGKVEIIVRYQDNESATMFATDKSSMSNLHQTITAVSGLGDGAFFAKFSSGKQTSNTLAARKGLIAIFITAPAALGAEKTLMTKLLAQL
jgi:hypothetical protein